jgi:FHS family L-fucose permease-like MFS transporter
VAIIQRPSSTGFDSAGFDDGPGSTDKRALSIVTTLFFMWGFLTCMNDILIPHLQSIFSLSYFQSMLIQFAFFGSYFIFAFPAGKLVEKIGYKRSMVAGLLIAAAGALLFLPASAVPSYPFFLGAQVILAAGITVLQVSANPYVSMIGPSRTASSRLNLTQAFNSLGTTIAPKFGGLFILTTATYTAAQMTLLSPSVLQAYRQQQASTVRLPYIGIALVLIVLGIALALLRLPQSANTQEFRTSEIDVNEPFAAIFKHSQLVMAAIGIFTYVGAEVSIGSFLVKYFHEPNIGNMAEQVAAGYVAFYWGGAMVGRFIGSAILQKARTGFVLGIAATVACLLVVTSIASFGHVALWSILAVGLFNSVMFPSIFTLGIEGLGPLTGRGSGLLVAAIVGGALIPLAEGKMADIIGVHHAFFIPAICYVYIAFFGYTRLKQGTIAAQIEGA